MIIEIFGTEGYVFWKEYVKFGKRLDLMRLPRVSRFFTRLRWRLLFQLNHPR
jgi:hypothetical protein